MSGHSKWAQIKRQKGVNDAKRGQAFTKLAMAITIAVREGGGTTDPDSNFKLRLVVDRARGINMPKENIERAIERGKGMMEKGGLDEVLYEGFGPGGAAFMVEAVTDNKQRTTSEVKNIIEKNGGVMGSQGAVAYQFEQKGLITIGKNGKSFDDVFMIAADAGAEDVEDVGQEVFVYTKPQDLKKVKDQLVTDSLQIKEAELVRKPLTMVNAPDKDTALKIMSFIEKIEESNDVQKVYTNIDIPEELLSDIN